MLIAGEPGVGKTALAEALAMYLISDAAPDTLAQRPLLEIGLPDIVAGARFRGDFEARMRALVDMARRRKAILFLDEIHLMIGGWICHFPGWHGCGEYPEAGAGARRNHGDWCHHAG